MQELKKHLQDYNRLELAEYFESLTEKQAELRMKVTMESKIPALLELQEQLTAVDDKIAELHRLIAIDRKIKGEE